MGLKILRQRWKSPPTPEGCRWCGIPFHQHYTSWVPSKGWHTYAQPTPAQIEARMRSRLKPVFTMREEENEDGRQLPVVPTPAA